MLQMTMMFGFAPILRDVPPDPSITGAAEAASDTGTSPWVLAAVAAAVVAVVVLALALRRLRSGT
jgi:anti-sigma-K factor RskA